VTALVQEVWNDRVWAARPMRLVMESDDATVLWFPHGTRWRGPDTGDDGPRAPRHAAALAAGEWTYRENVWDSSTLQIWPRGAWHAIWVAWRADGSRWGFYGNIQLPFERTSCGLRTMDLALDVVFELDGSWRLKDEDELAVFVERGIVDADLERRIRAEADAIVAKAERCEPPFDGSFDDWRPDPDWRLLQLPVGWERVCR
jgi:hypothetical protein